MSADLLLHAYDVNYDSEMHDESKHDQTADFTHS